jgi:hypothetical protein
VGGEPDCGKWLGWARSRPDGRELAGWYEWKYSLIENGSQLRKLRLLAVLQRTGWRFQLLFGVK